MLFREAEMAVLNEDIARRFVAECRRHRSFRDIHDRAALCRGSRRCRATHRDEDRQSAAYVDPRTVAGIARGDG